MYKHLDGVNSPGDIKALSPKDIPELCSEIREFLVEKVEMQGGHLASNLGAVELSVALHRVFNSPTDHIIFDVGHQSYVHKIITGRKDRFDTLRTTGGLSGFTAMKESEHDPFGAGHSSTAVSAALGYAESDRLKGIDAYTVAVIGDGAYTGGMVHEALNNCDPELKMIIILNENGMSISVNKGRFASYLSRVRMSAGYMKWKEGTKSFLEYLPLIGRPIERFLAFIKRSFKKSFMNPNYFEDLGLYYIGPVDGNDYARVENALKEAKRLGKCVILHVKTVKGKGYGPAEASPDDFHSVRSASGAEDSFHDVCVDELIKNAEEDESVVAVTAAMGMGTGLNSFGEKFPKRYFDVGIAEGHALTFSAGLAANGIKPFVGIYSTFLQRGYDSLVHDICLQNLPVKLLIDRASLAVSDGATHHGIFDVAYLSHIPNMTLFSPITYDSLRASVDYAIESSSAVAVRYPNTRELDKVKEMFYPNGFDGKLGYKTSFEPQAVPEAVFITYGSLAPKVIESMELLKSEGVSVGAILLERIKPLNGIVSEISDILKNARAVIFAEEGIMTGGAGMIMLSELLKLDSSVAEKYEIAAIDDNFASPDKPCDLYEWVGIGPLSLKTKMLVLLSRGRQGGK